MEIRFLGHACFEFVEGDANVLVDPFLTGNPSAAAEPHEVEATHILLTTATATTSGTPRTSRSAPARRWWRCPRSRTS